MKKRFLLTAICFLVFFGAIFAVGLSVNAQAEEIRESVFRFHVIANSNSDTDQQNKLAVRDGLAQFCSQLFEGSDNKAQSMEIARDSLEKIEAAAQKILVSRGDNSEVHATVTKRFFPTRHYEGVSLPAGVYDTLDVRIGKAAGKNFWCVMFPDICLGASSASDNRQKMSSVLSGGSLQMTTDSKSPVVTFKFKIIEIIEGIKKLTR